MPVIGDVQLSRGYLVRSGQQGSRRKGAQMPANMKPRNARNHSSLALRLLATCFITVPIVLLSTGAAASQAAPSHAPARAHVAAPVFVHVGRPNGPLIQAQPCTSGRATWFHMRIVIGENTSTVCFGFTGTWYFSGNLTEWTCSGNNRGTYGYTEVATGGSYSLGFLPGFNKTWSIKIDSVYLTITGWSGSNTC
jgi:hypothetical protein